MNNKKRVKEKSVRMSLYYEYISLIKLNKIYHLVNIDCEGYNLLIPNNYHIDYSNSIEKNDSSGHIIFRSIKSTYVIEYLKKDYRNFKSNIKKENNNTKRRFINYRNQEFIEIQKDNIDYLHMYYDGYEYRIYSDHKLSLNEYFDMYLILFSITKNKICEDIKLLKNIYYMSEQGLKSVYDDFDILLINLNDYTEDMELESVDVIVSKDDEYLKYKESINQIKYNSQRDLLIMKDNYNNWNVMGEIDFKALGKYNMGLVCDYNEITSSEELEEVEKIGLLKKIIVQKQLEINSNEEKINNEIYNYLYTYINNKLTYDEWNDYHIREFIKLDNISDNTEELSDDLTYQLFMHKIDTIENFISLINKKTIKESIKGEYIKIYPNKCVLRLSGLNYLISSLELICDDNFCLKKEIDVL